MATTIAPAQVAKILPLEVFTSERGGRSTITVSQGRVASDIELIRSDELRRIAVYELRVANDSPTALTCYVYAVRAGGGRPLTCASLAVAPFSGVAITFELPLLHFEEYDRITVELHGDGIDLATDTIPPRRSVTLASRRAAFLAATLVSLLAATFVGLAQPRVAALSAPTAALEGSRIALSYQSSGLGNVALRLISPTGDISEQHNLGNGRQSLILKLPQVRTTQRYLAQIEMQGLLGSDTRTVIVRDMATPTPRIVHTIDRVASIGTLSVVEPRIVSGMPIHVRHTFIGKTAMLRIVDVDGTTWASLLASSSGVTVLRAPHVDVVKNMSLVLQVSRGKTQAESRIALQIIPALSQTMPMHALPGAPISIGVGPYVAGAEIPVNVIRNVADLHIALQDGNGNEIEGFNVDTKSAVLHMPDTFRSKKYTLVMSYADRNGQETMVAPLNVSPGNL